MADSFAAGSEMGDRRLRRVAQARSGQASTPRIRRACLIRLWQGPDKARAERSGHGRTRGAGWLGYPCGVPLAKACSISVVSSCGRVSLLPSGCCQR